MDRTIKRYYKERQHGGRGTVARIADEIMLYAIAAVAGYLWFRYYVRSTPYVILLTTITTLFFFLAMRLWRSLRFDRFIRGEQRRLTDVVLRERLLLLPASGFHALCEKAVNAMEGNAYAEGGSLLWCMQQAAPIREDSILEAYRGAQEASARKLLLCSLSQLSEQAVALLCRLPLETICVPQEALFTAAHETAGYAVDVIDVEAYIHSEMRARKQRRERAQAQPFAPGNAKKYLFCAALLFAASFVVGYRLYYRLLAGVCVALFSMTMLLKKSTPASVVTEEG